MQLWLDYYSDIKVMPILSSNATATKNYIRIQTQTVLQIKFLSVFMYLME